MKTLDKLTQMQLTAITKKNFTKWHADGALLLLDAGTAKLESILDKLDDYTIDRRAQGRPVTRASIDGKNTKLYITSNGADEFILAVDDMQGSDYSHSIYESTGNQFVTVYVMK